MDEEGEKEVETVQDGNDSFYDDEVEVIEEAGDTCCQPILSPIQ